jgi:hypothetical protein
VLANKRISRATFLRSSAILGGAAALAACNLPPSVPTASPASASTTTTGAEDRAYWLALMLKIADPVLNNLAQGTLKAKMPIETRPYMQPWRSPVTHLEAVGRLLAGMAPWLALDSLTGAEEELRRRYVQLAVKAITTILDPQSPDSINFTADIQTLVDSAYLAHAVLRAPGILWQALGPQTQQRLVLALSATRVIAPYMNNWLLFSAMIEAMLYWAQADWDKARIDTALNKHEEWYKGDGHYGDGQDFHWDYYNSYVIHPMLLDILKVVSGMEDSYTQMQVREYKRAKRYAAIQERLIAPDGTYPPIGRSLAYRFGAFQLLAQMALQHQLTPGLAPSQVRAGLNAVIRRVTSAPGMFDTEGWLTIGLYGHQSDLAEDYISTGSLYMCTMGLLPLGLPPTDEFWSAPAQDWTSKRIWAGQNLPADHAL